MKESIFSMVFLLALHYSAVCQSVSAVNTADTSIFVSEEVPDDHIRFDLRGFQILLKSRLRMGGMEISDIIDKTDLVLRSEISVLVTLDGSRDDEPIMIYNCSLIAKSGKEVWRGKQTIRSKGDDRQNNEFASTRIAEKLISAKKRGRLKMR